MDGHGCLQTLESEFANDIAKCQAINNNCPPQIGKSKRTSLLTGAIQTLYSHRGNLFPHLTFCVLSYPNVVFSKCVGICEFGIVFCFANLIAIPVDGCGFTFLQTNIKLTVTVSNF